MSAPETTAENSGAYRAEDRFVYDEDGLKHISGTDTLSVAHETQNPKTFIKRQKQSLYAAYAQAEADNELFQTDTFVFDSDAKRMNMKTGILTVKKNRLRSILLLLIRSFWINSSEKTL